MRLRFAKSARSDIKHFQKYMADRNPDAAIRIIQQVRSVAKMLKENPLMGKVGRIHGTRALIVANTSLTLIYIAEKELINILFVPHHR